MREIIRPEVDLATSDQVMALFNWALLTTIGRGKHYGHCDAFGEIDLPELPDEINRHFPTPNPHSQSVRHSLYVTHELDHKTGQPRTRGVIANVMFNQNEQVDANLLYATHANYHIVNDGTGNLSLERHVTQTEHGPHMVRPIQSGGYLALIEQLVEMESLLAQEVVRHAAGKAAGEFDVTFDEAQQVIDTCALL
ncbi:MAG TPA: hypothetical protein VF733_05350 [Candidatus Saccharimonadales bacterium]